MDKNRKLIAKITVPTYIREIELSKAQRPKYYEWDNVTIKAKGKKLLQKYIHPAEKSNVKANGGNVTPQHLKSQYCIIGFKGQYIYSKIHNKNFLEEVINTTLTNSQLKKPIKYFLCEEVEDGLITYSKRYVKVVANEKHAGKPKIQVINGQNIYNHTASPFTTGKIFDAIKHMYYLKFKTIPTTTLEELRNAIKTSYPLSIEMEIRDTVKNFYDNTKEGNGRIWDVGNRADPYMKTFYDFLVAGYKSENLILLKPLITEDDRLHVSSGNNAHFTPIDNYENRALVFYFYQDCRDIWKQYQ